MDRLNSAAKIRTFRVRTCHAFGAQLFPDAARTASGFPRSDLEEVGGRSRHAERTLRTIIRCSGVPLPPNFRNLLGGGRQGARPCEHEQLQDSMHEQNDEDRGRDDCHGGWVCHPQIVCRVWHKDPLLAAG